MKNIIAMIIAILEALLLYKLINDESAIYKLGYKIFTVGIILAMIVFTAFAV